MEILRERTMESEKYRDNRYKYSLDFFIYMSEFFVYVLPALIICCENDNRTYGAILYLCYTHYTRARARARQQNWDYEYIYNKPIINNNIV